jgi:hypothetical protein
MTRKTKWGYFFTYYHKINNKCLTKIAIENIIILIINVPVEYVLKLKIEIFIYSSILI